MNEEDKETKLEKINHPIIRRALIVRFGEKFVFNYGDTGQTHSDHPGYDQYKNQSGYKEHSDAYSHSDSGVGNWHHDHRDFGLHF